MPKKNRSTSSISTRVPSGLATEIGDVANTLGMTRSSLVAYLLQHLVSGRVLETYKTLVAQGGEPEVDHG